MEETIPIKETGEAVVNQVLVNGHIVQNSVHDGKETEAVVTESAQDASLGEKNTAQAPPATIAAFDPQAILSQLQMFFESASTPALALVLAAAVVSVAIIFGRIGLLIIGILSGALGHAAIQNDGGKSGLSTWVHEAKVALASDSNACKVGLL